MLACDVWMLAKVSHKDWYIYTVTFIIIAQIGIFNLMEGNLSATFNGITLDFTLVCKQAWLEHTPNVNVPYYIILCRDHSLV